MVSGKGVSPVMRNNLAAVRGSDNRMDMGDPFDRDDKLSNFCRDGKTKNSDVTQKKAKILNGSIKKVQRRERLLD